MTGIVKRYDDIVNPAIRGSDGLVVMPLFTILSVLTCECWTCTTPRKVTPNMQMWVVAPSGAGKGESIGVAMEFLAFTGVDVPQLAGMTSAAGIRKQLHDDGTSKPLLAYIEEASGQLQFNNRAGMGDWSPLCCKIHDRATDGTNFAGEAKTIKKNPFLTIVADITPDKFVRGLLLDALSDGYLNRQMIVSGIKAKLPGALTDMDWEALEALAQEVAGNVARLGCPEPVPMTITDTAWVVYTEWRDTELEALSLGDDAYMYERSPVVAMRLAITAAASDGRRTIKRRDMTMAVAITRWLGLCAVAISKDVGISERVQLRTVVLRKMVKLEARPDWKGTTARDLRGISAKQMKGINNLFGSMPNLLYDMMKLKLVEGYMNGGDRKAPRYQLTADGRAYGSDA